MELKDTARKLLELGKPHWKMFAVSFLFFTLGAAVEPIIPALFKKLIDSGFKEGLSYPLWIVPIVIIGLFAIRGTFNFAGNYTMTSGVSSVVLDLRRGLMRGLLRADAKLFSNISPGIAVTKVINDPQLSSQILGNSMISIVKDAMSLSFLIGYLLYLNWQLTLLSFVCMPLLGLTVKLVQKRLNRIGQAQYESQQRLVNTVDDNARAWRVVRTFDAAEFELSRFDAQALQLRRLLLKTMATSSLITPMTQVVAAIGVSIIITLAIYQASQGSTTVG